mgnify:CR=1 FL=1
MTVKNIETRMEGSKLILTIDTTKTFGPSKSGKTIIVASTEGNVKVGNVTVGLNVYKGRSE